MECCISVGSSAVGKVGELMVQHVHSQLEFSFFYKNHLDNLKESSSRLEDAENRLKLSVQKALKSLEEIYDDVQHWLKKAHEVIEQAKRIVEQAEILGDARCGHGLFPNMKLRHRLGKEAYKSELEVREMLNTAPISEGVSYQPDIRCHIENEGYESFESRKQIFDEIRKALGNDDVNIIGVYGMAGIGKTMLVKEAAKQALSENLFSEAIITTVSQIPDYRRIQKEIAKQLDINFGEKTEISEIKVLLQKKLEVGKAEVDLENEGIEKQEAKKKILIVLDDIWEKFDLSVVGISFKSGRATCKVILTSRFVDVLRDDMDVSKPFPVSFLSDGEAMNLFKKIVRGKAEHSDFKDLAKDIVEECACLPIAIDTVASALKNKSVYEWRDALRQLRDSVHIDIKGMDERVFKSIETSYDFLRSEEAQKLLLFCCLYEEDANINVYHLLIHAVGLGMFKEVYKLEDAICRIHKLIDKLKDHCLLLKGDYDWCIKVHDTVRDFGIHFARANMQICNIRSDEEMEKWLDEKESENSAAISLQYDGIKSLPQRLDCPKLQLFWAWTDGKLQLPDLFFTESKELKVLDLSSLSLQQLPSSLCNLENLCMLCLSGCELDSVDRIGELKNLKVLALSGSNIVYLPKEIGQLTRLQLLDLQECDHLKKIHPGVLSKLTRLEELNMKGTYIEWEVERDKGERKNNASLNEPMGLCRLTAIHLNISSAHIAPKDLFNGKVLERYYISVNYPSIEPWRPGNWEQYSLLTTKRLRLNLEGIHFLEYDFGTLLESCEEMQLKGVEGVDSLVPGANTKGFPQLKYLKCARAEIQYVINSVQQSHGIDCGAAFKLLETLDLVSLMRLEQVCYGNLAPDSFSNLVDLKVGLCHKLRNLFPFSMAKQLSQLQILEVRDCKIIQEIVLRDGECSNNSITTIFPKLHTVRLITLPELLTFCSFKLMSSQKGLPLFSGQRLAPSLRELKIEKCHSVKYLFSSSIAAMLSRLNQLELISCGMMEEIIMMDNEEMGVLRFPQLKHLMLHDLPKFFRFYSGPSLQFPELNVVKLSECRLLVTFVSNSLSTDISKPSEGDISTSKVSLFNDELVAPNLTELTIGECGSLKSLCSSFFALKLVQINRLEIRTCLRMEEIIISMDEKIAKIEFHQLKHLILVSLPKLKRFWSGIPVQFPSSSNLITGSSIETLFSDNVAFPSLESMSIGFTGKLNAIWHNEQAMDSFRQLKEVYLDNITLKDFLVTRLPNLRCLETSVCHIQEKVSLPSLEVEKGSVHSCAAIVDSLLQLRIWNCWFKMALSPSTISSWKNVTFLFVRSCYGADNLLTCAAAQGLPQLKAMWISDCRSMIQVIASEGGNELTKVGESEIVFSQLELLVLEDLLCLKTFYSGSYILRFPKLIHLGVIRCPNMISFSDQVTDTPQLKKVSLASHDNIRQKLKLRMEPEDFHRLIYVCDGLSKYITIIEGNINNTIPKLRSSVKNAAAANFSENLPVRFSKLRKIR